MKKSFLLTLLSLVLAVSAFAEDEKHQSYLSYDDGGTVVRSGDEGREIDAHRNLPIYPGDEVVTSRRGRAEVRLSDGNIIGIDRTTAVRFKSILDAYEGEGDETVVELRQGKVAVHRTDLGRQHVRLDTDNASYVAERESVYSVETGTNGQDRVTVFDGAIEVRTRTRATRLRSGESATIDQNGVYDLLGDQRDSSDDFERWFLKRADRFQNYNNRYVDRRLGYWADDLDDHGRWVFVTGIGWSWRPYVAAGWRPYHNGYWHHGRGGYLTWVSYDPWAWGTYHYGRWAFDPGFGWIWAPGYGYSPAWVYWMYGSNYVGWAPSGYWDCYRPYYNWAYHPYRNYGYGRSHHNFGFYGRVRVSEVDLRPWTFVDSGVLISNRVDRAALTTDAIKQRLSRSPDGYATLNGGASRFTRDEFRDPAAAIKRRGLDGRMTGQETGAPPTDLTPFVRRDADVGSTIRDRIVRSREGAGGGAGSGAVAGGSPATGSRAGSSGLAPIGRGGVAPIGRGSVAPIGGGSSSVPPATATPSTGDRRRDGGISRDRGTTPPADASGGNRDASGSSGWRDRVRDRGTDRGSVTPSPSAPSTTPSAGSSRSGGDSWRSRVRSSDPSTRDEAPSADRGNSSSDVPRRVIDRIGGARVVPRETDSSTGSDSSKRDRSTVRERERSRDSGSSNRGSSTRDSGSSNRGSSTRDSGSSNRGSSGGSSARPSSPPPSRDSGSSSRGNNNSGGGNRSSGGKVQRDQ
ncbi:MAG TPA: DUF6600 domain-containing protein [Thermoanaerobaculia bacterium]|nr:DUF6600 domain-containing protein [Thermoanaerobaculia bacterium]